jgi:LPXTG-motif cell wall-anchored protein
LKITSYSKDSEGNKVITNSRTVKIEDENEYTLSVNAKEGDFIDVEAIGVQNLEKGVYFYEAEGGAGTSQSLVGVAEGETPVHAVRTFVFEKDIDTGLRIYKKSTEDQTPISDITFDVYSTDLTTVEQIKNAPTSAEVAKYAVSENLVGSVTTDVTGYAKLGLGYGTYLVVERHNEEKVLAPADPFYIMLPWPVEVEVDGEKVIEYQDIVSVYPKNTPITPPPPPPPPPPSEVKGQFTIIKHDNNDETDLLEGAKFKIYRAATDEDTETETILCNGLECAVVPVEVDGKELVLTTDSEGKAISPELDVGVYYIKETKAPIGYVLPKEAKSVTVISKEIAEETIVYIGNDRGIKLPATGGIGTNIFVLLGCIVCLGSIALIVIKRRIKNLKEL